MSYQVRNMILNAFRMREAKCKYSSFSSRDADKFFDILTLKPTFLGTSYEKSDRFKEHWRQE